MALNIGSAVAFLELDTSKFTSGFKEAKKSMDDFTKKGESVSNRLKGLSGSFSSMGKTLSASVTLPLSGIATAASGAAMSLESATNKISSYFGDVGEEAKRNERIVQEVFASGIPDSMEETADTIIAVRKNLKDLSDSEMVNVSKQATILEQKFGIDMNETLRGVNSLMENFGMTSEEAMNYVVVATQRGLDKTNELGDNLAEYGSLWEQAGFSAQEMFAILENGLESGAYNLDKVNDFVKEFTISLADGRIEENLGSFSQGTQDLFYQWKDGKATAKDVFYSIISDMETTMSKQEALTVASTVWSSLGEDNAMDVITALNDVNNAYDDVNGAAQQMVDIQQSGASGALGELKNNAQLLAAEVGERLTPNIEETADKILELTEKVKTLNPEVIDIGVKIGKVAAVVGPGLLVISKLISAIANIGKALSGLGKVMSTIGKLTGITKLFSGIAETFALVSGGAATLGETLPVVFPIIGKIAGAFTSLGGILSSIGSVLATVGSAIVGVLGGPLTIVIGVVAALSAAFVTLWNTCDGFREFWINLWENIKSAASNAFNDLQQFFSEVGEKLSEFTDSVGEFFVSIPETLSSVFSGIGDTVSEIFETVKNTLVEFGENVVEFFTSIPENISNLFSNIGDFFGGVFENISNIVQSWMDTISGVVQAAGQAIQTFLSDPFYYMGYVIGQVAGTIYVGIQTLIQNIVTFVTETIPAFFTSIVEWFAQLREDIFNKISEIFADVSLWATNMWNKAIELGINFFNSIVEWFSQLPGKIYEFVTDAYNRVSKWASNMWNKALELGTNFLNTIVQFFSQLPGRIWNFVSDVYNRVSSWASNMWNKAREMGTNFLNSVTQFFSQLPGRVWSFISDTYNRVVSWGSDMANKARETATNFLNNMVDTIRSLPDRIWGIISQIPGRVTAIGSELYNAGRDILNRLWDGIRSIGNSILGWFGNFVSSIGSFISGILSGFNDVVRGADRAKSAARSVNGSHANGLRYVPFDGYIAELHQGERVLTKQEAESYNRGEGSGGGDTFVFYNTKPDPYEYARQMKRAKEELG